MATEPTHDDAWVVASIILVGSDADVLVSARTLTTLISFALTGPTNVASRRARDGAVENAHRAFTLALEAQP